jgi:hypothetical protein
MSKISYMAIVRQQQDDKQTLGRGVIFDPAMDEIFTFYTLELPWKENRRRLSCIPANTYWVKKRWSEKYGWHLHILDVPGRDWILIHFGNYHTDILGCILPGNNHVDINGDGHKDETAALAKGTYYADLKVSLTAAQPSYPVRFELILKATTT